MGARVANGGGVIQGPCATAAPAAICRIRQIGPELRAAPPLDLDRAPAGDPSVARPADGLQLRPAEERRVVVAQVTMVVDLLGRCPAAGAGRVGPAIGGGEPPPAARAVGRMSHAPEAVVAAAMLGAAPCPSTTLAQFGSEQRCGVARTAGMLGQAPPRGMRLPPRTARATAGIPGPPGPRWGLLSPGRHRSAVASPRSRTAVPTHHRLPRPRPARRRDRARSDPPDYPYSDEGGC